MVPVLLAKFGKSVHIIMKYVLKLWTKFMKAWALLMVQVFVIYGTGSICEKW